MEKLQLIALVEELLKEDNLENRTEDLRLLKREYKRLVDRDEDSFYEKQQSDKFIELYTKLAEKESKLMLSSYDEKKAIIASIKKLANRKDILKASKEFDQLSEDFRKAGRCSKEQDDELWQEFKEAKQLFYDKKKAHFAELDKANAEKRAKKEDIIARAKKVTELENMKEASAQMDELMKEWKEVGYSGKDDETLWKEFSKALDLLRQKRKEYHQEMLKTFEERAAKKEELILTVKKILADSDFSEEEVKRIKDLRREFNNIGFAGKDKDDDLYDRFDEVIKKYFDEKKFYTY